MTSKYRFSSRVYAQDGSSFPVASNEPESPRAISKHAIAAGYVKVVNSERVGDTDEWRHIFTVTQWRPEYEAD